MTDNEIIKALENEIDTAEECDNDYCYEIDIDVIKSAIDLINRQKSEIERLKKTQRIEMHIDKEFYNECQYEMKQAKPKAIKQFAERLKETYKNYDQNVGAVCKSVLFNDIDNLVKEMTGE